MTSSYCLQVFHRRREEFRPKIRLDMRYVTKPKEVNMSDASVRGPGEYVAERRTVILNLEKANITGKM